MTILGDDFWSHGADSRRREPTIQATHDDRFCETYLIARMMSGDDTFENGVSEV